MQYKEYKGVKIILFGNGSYALACYWRGPGKY